MDNYYKYKQGHDEMYYRNDGYDRYDNQNQEHYYEGNGMENQHEGTDKTMNQAEDEAHFLQDFGY